MKIALGVFLMLHGFAHLVGFFVPWRLLSNAEMPYKTTLLAGHWEVGAWGIRVDGLLWLAAAIMFMVAGVGGIRQFDWSEPFTLYITLASLALCVVSWPEARIGVWVNLALLLVLFFTKKLSWLPGF